MTQGKYYDHARGRPVDLEKDGCPLSDWAARHGQCAFARHPDGFPVFAPPGAIDLDEYERGDPYGVEASLDSNFQRRRLECTLELIGLAVSGGQPISRVLDLGCGEGQLTAGIKDLLPAAEVSGLDLSVAAIAEASRARAGIDFAVGDAVNPPYSASYFDLVVINNLLEHVPSPLELVRRIGLITRPVGWIVLSTPSRYRFENLVRALGGRPMRLMSPHHVTEYSLGQVVEFLQAGGFRVERVLSRPIPPKRFSFKAVMATYLALPLARAVLRPMGLEASMESTMFFLGRHVPVVEEHGSAAPAPDASRSHAVARTAF